MSKRLWILSPATMMVFGFLSFYVFVPLFHPEQSCYSGFYAKPELFVFPYLYILICTASFFLGYYFIARILKETTLIPRKYIEHKYHRYLPLLCIAMWVGSIVSVSRVYASSGLPLILAILPQGRSGGPFESAIGQGSYITYTKIVAGTLQISASIITGFILSQIRLRRFIRVVLLALWALVVASALSSGTRYHFLYVLIPGLLIYRSAWWKSASLKSITRTVTTVVLIVLFGISLQWLSRGVGGLWGISNIKASNISSMGGDPSGDQGVFLHGVIASLDRNDLETLNGDSYLMGLLWFIPRAVWPSKPGSDFNVTIMPTYRGTNIEYNPRTTISLGILGELVLNYGLIITIIVMYVYGLALGFIWNQFRLNINSVYAWMYYAPTTVLVYMLVRGGFASMWSPVSSALVVVYALMYLIRRLDTSRYSVPLTLL
jgi:hypothetical protein